MEALMTIGIYGIAWIGSKIGVSKPSLSITFENTAKFVGYATIADTAIDYARRIINMFLHHEN